MATKSCLTNIKPAQIKAAEPSDLHNMALCHISCFPKQFTSHMGPRFARAFYESYLSQTDGLAFVAVEEKSNKVVGLVAGGHFDIRSEFLRKAPYQFLGTLLFKCLSDRLVCARVINHLVQRVGWSRCSKMTDDTFGNWSCDTGKNRALLQVICVRDEYRGTQVAKNLIEAFKCACQQAGYDTLSLSVASNNARAIAFYRKLGWKVITEKADTIHMGWVITNRQS